MRKLLRTHLIPLGILTLLILILTRHIWGTRAWIETHDGIFHVIRLEAFVEALKSGQFPVRWAGSLDNGYGLPLFNFVYPLPYYLGSPLLMLGLSAKWVIKLLGIATFALGAYGYYILGARWSKSVGLLASVTFLTTPYILVNLFVRGALGEFMALAFFPWVMLMYKFQKDSKSWRWYYPLPLTLMLLSHNFLGLILLALSFVFAWFDRVPKKPLFLTTLSSLGLSAFFLIPMLLERNLVHSGAGSDFTYTFRDHFILAEQLLYSPWGLGHSVAGAGDGFSLQIGIPHLLILISGLVILQKNRFDHWWLYLVSVLGTILLLLPLSGPLWELLLPLQIMQFPWRLLGVVAILTPLIITLSKPDTSRPLRLTLFLSLLVATLFALNYTTPFYFQNNEQFATQMYIHRDKTTTSKRTELLPKWVTVEERYLPIDQVRISSGSASLNVTSNQPTQIIFTLDTTDNNTELIVSRNYYPSWVITDESKQNYIITPTETGELSFVPSLGDHTYTLVQKSTTVATISNFISLLTLLFMIMQPLRTYLKNILDHKYTGWDLSIALRYLPIVDELKKHARDKDKILEVGSEITGITPYYPRQITGLDQGFDYSKQNKYLKPVVGSATKIPFAAQSFDYTLSVDCIEHIPANLRAKAVLEMMRVTKKRLYLTFPVGKLSEETDAYLDHYFYQKNGYHFTYLSEHVENGLPSTNFIADIVAKHPEWKLEIRGNTSLWLWKAMLMLGLSNQPVKTSLYRRLLFLTPILKHLNFAPTYRMLYILSRKES